MAFIKGLLPKIRFGGQAVKDHGHCVQNLASFSQSYSPGRRVEVKFTVREKAFPSTPACSNQPAQLNLQSPTSPA